MLQADNLETCSGDVGDLPASGTQGPSLDGLTMRIECQYVKRMVRELLINPLAQDVEIEEKHAEAVASVMQAFESTVEVRSRHDVATVKQVVKSRMQDRLSLLKRQEFRCKRQSVEWPKWFNMVRGLLVACGAAAIASPGIDVLGVCVCASIGLLSLGTLVSDNSRTKQVQGEARQYIIDVFAGGIRL